MVDRSDTVPAAPERRRRVVPLLALVARLLLVLVLFLAVNVLAGSAFDQEAPYDAGLLGSAAVSAALYVAGVLAVVLLLCRFVDRRPWRGLGLRGPAPRALREGGAGFALAFALIAAVFAVQLLAGFVTVDEVRWRTLGVAAALGAVLVVVLVEGAAGFTEEVVFRGYVLSNVGERAPVWVGAAVTTLVFALLHVGNTGFGPLWVLGVFVIATFFVVTRLVTGALWFAIGFHAAWNIAQYGVFGLGNVADPPEYGYGLLAVTQTGPAWLVGEGQSVEGGLLLYGAVLVALAVLVARRPEGLTGLRRRLDRDGDVVAAGTAGPVTRPREV